jgi:DNA-binding transcriptional ArsR family regulator
MARAPTTTDVFSAIAEPRRRDIIECLAARGPTPVLALADSLSVPQPAISKHLAVLRQVGLVSVTRRGRERIYRLNPQELKTVHDWSQTFERFWTHQLTRIQQRAEQRAADRAAAHLKEKRDDDRH